MLIKVSCFWFVLSIKIVMSVKKEKLSNQNPNVVHTPQSVDLFSKSQLTDQLCSISFLFFLLFIC